jgi:hypothetical protein
MKLPSFQGTHLKNQLVWPDEEGFLSVIESGFLSSGSPFLTVRISLITNSLRFLTTCLLVTIPITFLKNRKQNRKRFNGSSRELKRVQKTMKALPVNDFVRLSEILIPINLAAGVASTGIGLELKLSTLKSNRKTFRKRSFLALVYGVKYAVIKIRYPEFTYFIYC